MYLLGRNIITIPRLAHHIRYCTGLVRGSPEGIIMHPPGEPFSVELRWDIYK